MYLMDMKLQGKRNRQAGLRFEKKVREDLEGKNWIVSKWQNNLTNIQEVDIGEYTRKCVPAKPGRFRMMQTGFPDFIAYKIHGKKETKIGIPFEDKIIYPSMTSVIFVECKTNGYLSKEEKEKASWYLENNYCSKFLIASRGEKRGTIKYIEFEDYGKKKKA